MPFEAVFADTGNEHEITLEYIKNLPLLTGGPAIKTVKADFSQKICVRRANLEKQLETGDLKRGWTAKDIERVLEHLHPTGNPFLDLCLWKGRFPSTKASFCTTEVKMMALRRQSIEPAIVKAISQGGYARRVVSWIGIRRDESPARAEAEEWDVDSLGSLIYRPLVDWPKEKCFGISKKHNVPPNPLYKMGCGRVGCMPCINSRKAEMREISFRFPEHIDRIREWERLVSLCSKRKSSTFFSADRTPGEGDTRSHIDNVVEWSKTGYGGRQYSFFELEEPPACSSLYGLCE